MKSPAASAHEARDQRRKELYRWPWSEAAKARVVELGAHKEKLLSPLRDGWKRSRSKVNPFDEDEAWLDIEEVALLYFDDGKGVPEPGVPVARNARLSEDRYREIATALQRLNKKITTLAKIDRNYMVMAWYEKKHPSDDWDWLEALNWWEEISDSFNSVVNSLTDLRQLQNWPLSGLTKNDGKRGRL